MCVGGCVCTSRGVCTSVCKLNVQGACAGGERAKACVCTALGVCTMCVSVHSSMYKCAQLCEVCVNNCVCAQGCVQG